MDGSKNSVRGLKFALCIARQSGAHIIGLNVNSLPPFMRLTATLRDKTKQKSGKIIREAKTMSQKDGVSFSGVIKTSDNVGRTIVAFAESHKADMITIGSRGPDSENELFLGSVANMVINKSKIPVTIVK